MVRIAIDVMGGDHAPNEIINGCVLALEKFSDIELLLFGNENAINHGLENQKFDDKRLRIFGTTEIITNDEAPVQAVRTKKDASLVRALEAVSQGNARAFVGAGSTGAVLAGATFIVRRIKGLKRPALSPILPTVDGKGVLLVDCGANVDCKPAHLQQFGLMGSAYMQHVMGVKKPRVGLINNGAEEEKGNELTKEAHQLLKRSPINFVGNCEARDVISGNFDVVVADGFVGNVVLKLTEGVAMSLTSMLKESLMSSTRSKIGAMLCKPALKDFKTKMDYTEHGGAILLGVNAGVIKAHGSSNAYAFYNAIRQARETVHNSVVSSIAQAIEAFEIDS